jgi:hypothetical protein
MKDSFREIHVIAVLLRSDGDAYHQIKNIEPQLGWKDDILHFPSDVRT